MVFKCGRFITFEGCDGVGKSTQIAMLSDFLINKGINVIQTREPGGTVISERIRDILKSSSHIDVITEMLLMFAARREHFIQKIKPALDAGSWVLCDRFCDSTIVYQGVLKNVDIKEILHIQQLTIGDFEPDLTILLDISYTSAQKRVNLRSNDTTDNYDFLSKEKYDKMRSAYKKLSSIYKRINIVNGSKNVLSVNNEICCIVSEKLL